jgi:P27 family predicted phage terminase small subunit
MLNAAALDEWHRITALLHHLGLLCRLDTAALAIYCQAFARWQKAETEIASTSEVVKSPSGFPIVNPWLAVAAAAAKQVDGKLTEFGLSPSARGRLFAAAPPKKADAPPSKWKGLLAGV